MLEDKKQEKKAFYLELNNSSRHETGTKAFNLELANFSRHETRKTFYLEWDNSSRYETMQNDELVLADVKQRKENWKWNL